MKRLGRLLSNWPVPRTPQDLEFLSMALIFNSAPAQPIFGRPVRSGSLRHRAGGRVVSPNENDALKEVMYCSSADVAVLFVILGTLSGSINVGCNAEVVHT